MVVGITGAYNYITGRTQAKLKDLTTRAETAEKNHAD
jgi:hypothetical protein